MYVTFYRFFRFTVGTRLILCDKSNLTITIAEGFYLAKILNFKILKSEDSYFSESMGGGDSKDEKC